MRKNLPVTGREYPFPPGMTIVSTTDLKGRITYCNSTFITVSGFTEEELLGQPHNLVRHPDMPREAFRDLWATIKRGEPWTGLVKNRRKDGDHYWVVANVTPLVQNGQVTGYMSVRTEATRAQIVAAEKLYERMRAEDAQKRRSLRLEGGHLSAGLLGTLGRVRKLGAAGQIGLGLLAVAAASVAHPLAAAAVAIVAFAILRARLGLPLEALIRRGQAVAACDLGQPALAWQRRDELGRLARALDQLQVNVQAVVGDVRREVDSMHGGINTIADATSQLSQRTFTQASSLEETAASIEQITGAIATTSDAATRCATLAQGAVELTADGVARKSSLEGTMDEIASGARQIATASALIDEVARQTNILALNASVEAARAGEHGRGFAVVAAEVRELAQRSASAAREIRASIEASLTNIASGKDIVANMVHTIDATATSVSSTRTLIEQVSSASREQSSGADQINKALLELDTITQENAGMVSEFSENAAALADRSKALVRSVSVFRLAA